MTLEKKKPTSSEDWNNQKQINFINFLLKNSPSTHTKKTKTKQADTEYLVLHMMTICLLQIFFHTNDSPRETSMQLWSHSMKTSLHYHISVYPCADAFAAVVLRLRWNFNSCNTYLLTYTHSRCLRTYSRQTYSCKREVQSSDMGPI